MLYNDVKETVAYLAFLCWIVMCISGGFHDTQSSRFYRGLAQMSHNLKPCCICSGAILPVLSSAHQTIFRQLISYTKHSYANNKTLTPMRHHNSSRIILHHRAPSRHVSTGRLHRTSPLRPRFSLLPNPEDCCAIPSLIPSLQLDVHSRRLCRLACGPTNLPPTVRS